MLCPNTPHKTGRRSWQYILVSESKGWNSGQTVSFPGYQILFSGEKLTAEKIIPNLCHWWRRTVLRTPLSVLYGRHRRTYAHSASTSLSEHLLGPGWCVWSVAIICSTSLCVCVCVCVCSMYYLFHEGPQRMNRWMCVCASVAFTAPLSPIILTPTPQDV